MSNKEYNSDTNACKVCGFEAGQPLESFEDGSGSDFELIDDYGRTTEIDASFRICRPCLKESHDTHWYATHPEFLGFRSTNQERV